MHLKKQPRLSERNMQIENGGILYHITEFSVHRDIRMYHTRMHAQLGKKKNTT